ncbi:hypothetical protein CNMCM5793_005262 [Aspergillus hiratsukae]|uniref:Glucose-methanol-choline oxidoreductase N-terminal domain-containing protein n=1 Tax=Aspergillus hiratsukae TaxID=1194566 RepID=A0A8H6UI74_9EURO|nr:hypothetical protein CNMCM5793_005262 [Aspergillus hiratsukae]
MQAVSHLGSRLLLQMARLTPPSTALSAVWLALLSLILLAQASCSSLPKMNIYTQLPSNLTEVNVVIAGGGTAGLIVASRLSDADPSLVILVVEAGQNKYEDSNVAKPVLFLNNLMPGSTTAVTHVSVKEPAVGDRQLAVPIGGTLGGSSSINIMMYSRAQRSDLDAWAMPGWSADDLLPYMKKLETYFGEGGTPGTHGNSGPVQISCGTYAAPGPQDDFIQAAQTVGWPEYPDLQDLDTNNGVQKAMRFVGPDGIRQSTAHAYLHSRLLDGKHPNLHVLVEHQVSRVVFHNTRAAGVEIRPNPLFQDGTTYQTVKADRLTVVSAGSLGSPSVLERSGVGNPDVLSAAGVDLVASVRGVGSNYQDHHLLSYSYYASLLPNETVDGVITGRVDTQAMIANNDSMLGWNAQDITCKLRPSDADVASLSSAFQDAWNSDFANQPDKPLMLMAPINGFPGDPSTVPAGQYYSLSTFSVYPYSRGYLHIKGPIIDDGEEFYTGFFADQGNIDIQKHMWAYKKQREIFRRMKTYRGEVPSMHPPFSNTSDAALVHLDAPLPDDVQDIVYTSDDDAVLEQYLRNNVGTTWHSMGTCKMAKLEDGGVVDANLSVYGVEGLKVADLSIPPSNVAANTANTAMFIGEKAADIIIKELGLRKCGRVWEPTT